MTYVASRSGRLLYNTPARLVQLAGLETKGHDEFAALARCVTTSRYTKLKHLAGIHDAVRIESALEFAHQLQFERRLVALDFVAFQLTEPMLGAD